MSRAARESVSLPSGVRGGPLLLQLRTTAPYSVAAWHGTGSEVFVNRAATVALATFASALVGFGLQHLLQPISRTPKA